jgi:hypothetical protein
MQLILTANGRGFTHYDLPAQSAWTEHFASPLLDLTSGACPGYLHLAPHQLHRRAVTY